MRILIAAATSVEVAPLVASLRGAEETPDPFSRGRAAKVTAYVHAGHGVDVLVTGIGMVATAAWCSRALARHAYDLALNVGVCGAYNRALAPGTVVHVVSDCIAELGAEDDDAFLTLKDLRLPGDDEFPVTGGRLVNASPLRNATLSALPAVHGITVNKVHGNDRSIAAVAERFKPDVESMEGAAFMYACMLQELPFAQLRAVSNVVERRNRSAWKITEAVDGLAHVTLSILDHS